MPPSQFKDLMILLVVAAIVIVVACVLTQFKYKYLTMKV